MNPSRTTRTGAAYILLLFLARRKRIKVGALGVIAFEPGFYLYVGSGGRSPLKRISRHLRRGKKKFWHIDYLSAHAEVIGAALFEGPCSLECPIAASLDRVFHSIGGFGCSDCSCRSHLFLVPGELNLRR